MPNTEPIIDTPLQNAIDAFELMDDSTREYFLDIAKKRDNEIKRKRFLQETLDAINENNDMTPKSAEQVIKQLHDLCD